MLYPAELQGLECTKLDFTGTGPRRSYYRTSNKMLKNSLPTDAKAKVSPPSFTDSHSATVLRLTHSYPGVPGKSNIRGKIPLASQDVTQLSSGYPLRNRL